MGNLKIGNCRGDGRAARRRPDMEGRVTDWTRFGHFGQKANGAFHVRRADFAVHTFFIGK